MKDVLRSSHSSSSDSFDAYAESFDRFAELVGEPLDTYLASVFPSRGARAVDLGCGTGRHATLLAAGFRQVVGVDISAPMLQIARRRRNPPNVTYQERDLRTLRPDSDGTFDLVFSSYALHHVDDLDATLIGIRELAAPGGRVVLVDNVAPRPAVPRRWFVKEAVRILAADLVRRRRPPGEAWELFRLNTHPAWLDHLTSDRFLSPAGFQERYGSVFPGARYTDLYRARALCWDVPGTG
jgi:SAM-dependent methyltransferase